MVFKFCTDLLNMKYWLHINIFSSLGAGFPFKSLKNTRPHRIKTQKVVLLELRKNGTFLFANYISIKKYKKSALLELEIEGHRGPGMFIMGFKSLIGPVERRLLSALP